MLYESDRDQLSVFDGDEIIAQFTDGKFATTDKKTMKILDTVPGVHAVDLAGVDPTIETDEEEAPATKRPAAWYQSKKGGDQNE